MRQHNNNKIKVRGQKTTQILGWFFCALLISFAGLVTPAVGYGAETTDRCTPPCSSQSEDPAQLDDDFDQALSEDLLADDQPILHDPIEPFNRAMFWFNDRVYFLFLKPIARLTRHIPEPVRASFDRFFTNLEHPIYVVNAALQLKFRVAATDLARFGINSTVGLLGFFDPAKHTFKLTMQEEDFGQTLGRYGIGHGIYLVVPLVGSSSIRDITGRYADFLISPSHLILDNEGQELAYRTIDTINEFSLDKDTYELIKKTALDPYLFVRDAYQQRRAKMVAE
ncbi:MAG: VacJ family lipoprotein [Gammaproteobacteria bacterium]|nr:MAG: VacJ family lipoprotein [Gammaproteobacteria bacterium]